MFWRGKAQRPFHSAQKWPLPQTVATVGTETTVQSVVQGMPPMGIISWNSAC